MAGHVSRDRIAIRIREVSRRPVRFFACVRNATDHLASHYNWLLSLGDQFDKGSHLNRIYSAMVGNGSTPEGVIQTLKEFPDRSEEHTSELQSLMRISYAAFSLNKT